MTTQIGRLRANHLLARWAIVLAALGLVAACSSQGVSLGPDAVAGKVPDGSVEMREVQVAGQPVHVKLALHNGRVVNVQPEYEDVVRVSTLTGRPVKDVLADAAAAGRLFRADDDPDPE